MVSSFASTAAGMTAARFAGNRGHNAVVRTVVAMLAQETVKVRGPTPKIDISDQSLPRTFNTHVQASVGTKLHVRQPM